MRPTKIQIRLRECAGWIFAGRTCPKFRFLMLRLLCRSHNAETVTARVSITYQVNLIFHNLLGNKGNWNSYWNLPFFFLTETSKSFSNTHWGNANMFAYMRKAKKKKKKKKWGGIYDIAYISFEKWDPLKAKHAWNEETYRWSLVARTSLGLWKHHENIPI